jgi:hypothetical protein
MKRQQPASLSLTSRDSSIHAKQQRCFKFTRRRFSVSLAKARYAPCGSENCGASVHRISTRGHTYATLLKGNGEDVKVVQELMRHANISVTLNVYAQAITQTKRDAQSRVVSLLLDKNEEKPSTEAYRTVTDLQNSGGDLQVVDKVGVPDGI